MVKSNLLEWFPQGETSIQSERKEDEVAIPLSKKSMAIIKMSSLTEREQQVVSLLTGEESAFDEVDLGTIIWFIVGQKCTKIY